MEKATRWTARPVFISSTFLDMQAERDHLRTHVFPALEERLRARRQHLEWVDLRIGVAAAGAEAEARELQVLKVCLAEVRRCRPFLIVLLGDRYGWIPPPERIAAATREEGMAGDFTGRSVTELEIEFGVLADPAQRQRSLFYFREPLPYREMGDLAAAYSDAQAKDQGAVALLAALKRRIRAAAPHRVRHYSATWDSERQTVTGLEAWGCRVLEDLWSQIEAELPASPAQAEITWQQAERDALDDFAEDRARDFVGREPMLDRLTALIFPKPRRSWVPTPEDWSTAAIGHNIMSVQYAIPPEAMDPPPDPDAQLRGLCVTGEAGSGKSALFAEFYRRLKATDAFVLAHAAGASQRSTSVDSMLRRWIDELATALAIDAGLAEDADAETVERTFATLLQRMAERRRVAVIVDALDQFEPTPRGRFITWLPPALPDNVRLIATAIPGEASNRLAGRADFAIDALPPLDAAEARGIVKAICDRYHRTQEPAVVDALLAKAGADGFAWAKPLWLVLAVEELNLLDADDFARAARRYGGPPADRIRALMLDTVAGLPPDIASLYAASFERAEQLFGAALTRSFLGLIAVSRAGWRESDFESLLPRLTGEPWDPLRFANLRRLFRGQLRRRGGLGQWDFSHAQMRAAAGQHVRATGAKFTDLNAKVAEYLIQAAEDDALARTETMFHLLSSENWLGAARYFGASVFNETSREAATRALADFMLGDRPDDSDHAFHKLAPIVDAIDIDDAVIYQTAVSASPSLRTANSLMGISDDEERLKSAIRTARGHLTDRLASVAFTSHALAHDLSDDLYRRDAPAALRIRLAERLDAMFRRLLTLFSEDLPRSFPSYLSKAHVDWGTALRDSGKLDEAIAHLRTALKIQLELARTLPSDPQLRGNLSVRYNKLGDTLLMAGRAEEALESFQQGLAIAEALAAADGGATAWQYAQANSLVGLGKALSRLGRREAAARAFERSLTLAKKHGSFAPSEWWSLILARSHEGLAASEADENKARAIDAQRRAVLALENFAQVNPNDARLQGELASAREKLADLLTMSDESEQALGILAASLDGLQRMVASEPDNPYPRSRLASVRLRMGVISSRIGRDAESLHHYEESRAALADLLSRHPHDGDVPEWRRWLSWLDEGLDSSRKANSESKPSLLDEIQRHQQAGAQAQAAGDLERALAEYRTCLRKAEIAERESRNSALVTVRSMMHASIGRLLRQQGNASGALDSYRRCLACVEKAPGDFDFLVQPLATVHAEIAEILEAQGDIDGALSSLRGSLALREQAAGRSPNEDGLAHEVSVCHEKMGDLLADQGHLAAALASHRAALAIRERLAQRTPYDIARQMYLMNSHLSVGFVYEKQSRLEDARRHYQTALEIGTGPDAGSGRFERQRAWLKEAIARTRPPPDPGRRQRMRDEFARRLDLGEACLESGDLDGAAKAFRESLATATAMAEIDPGDSGPQSDLAAGHRSIAKLLQKRGDSQGAIAAFRRSLTILDGLLSQNPRDIDLLRHLLGVQLDVAEVLTSVASYQEAVTHFDSAITALERLLVTRPDDEAVLNYRTAIESFITASAKFIAADGDVRRTDIDRPAAVDAYRASLALHRLVAQRLTGGLAAWRQVSEVAERLADAQMDRGEAGDAVEAYRASASVRERLLRQASHDDAGQHALAIIQIKIGDALSRKGDATAASDAYKHALERLEALLPRNPHNGEMQRDLALAHERIGEALKGRRELERALESYRASVGIMERLVTGEGRNAGWIRHLSTTYLLLGETLEDLGRVDEALAAYRSSAAVAGSLSAGAALDEDAAWLRNQALCHERIAKLLDSRDTLAEAHIAHHDCLRKLVLLERHSRDDAEIRRWQAVKYMQLGWGCERDPRLGDPREYYSAGLSIIEELLATKPENEQWQADRSWLQSAVARL